MKYHLVEKANHRALHGIFESKDSADRFLAETVPQYVARRLYSDKSLTAASFEVIPAKATGDKS